MAVFHEDNEIGKIAACFGTHQVRHFEAEIMILGVSQHFRMGLGQTAKLCLPVAIQNDPIHLILWRRSTSFPAFAPGCIEAHILRRTDRVEGV